MIDGQKELISTHSAREDGDVDLSSLESFFGQFQPTPPARTETSAMAYFLYSFLISTHSAREDGDPVNKLTL